MPVLKANIELHAYMHVLIAVHVICGNGCSRFADQSFVRLTSTVFKIPAHPLRLCQAFRLRGLGIPEGGWEPVQRCKLTTLAPAAPSLECFTLMTRMRLLEV